jgi:hypothetical protein
MMRATGGGKADLTDSAARLTLSGARGVAVTSLWLAAIEKQKRHEWNELEVLVETLTRLQPRFVSPWLFQGWNLAFNVSVECDRPRDKYYYITRGIALLCKGEEKNDPGMAVPPQPWPASPEMRFQIGFTYQLKIGQGDEKKTQSCLFEMSSIPLKERDPLRFWMQGQPGKVVNLPEFLDFCQKHPRMVRRLKERLTDPQQKTGFSEPEDIIGFLTDNKDVPSRIEDRSKLDDEQRLEEFPILPPQNKNVPSWHKYVSWKDTSLSTASEDFDVFICCRAWYAYAQLPLPEDDPDPGMSEKPFDRLHYRLPKMATIIFRTYPARAQAYHGEYLQLDGWYDDSGWFIADWFDSLPEARLLGGVVVGDGERFDSAKAWGKAYDLYKIFGERNGVYIEPGVRAKLDAQAKKEDANSSANKKIMATDANRALTNFDALFNQCAVERTPEAVAARKAIFKATRLRLAAERLPALRVYREEAMPQWLDLLLRYPEFRNISTIQEETYELQIDYFEMVQRQTKKFREFLEKTVTGLAMSPPLWPQGGLVIPLFDLNNGSGAGVAAAGGVSAAGCMVYPSGGVWPQQQLVKLAVEKTKNFKILPLRDVEGMFDQLFVLEVPEPDPQKRKQITDLMTALPQVLARQALWPPPPVEKGTPDFAFARFVVWPPPKKNEALEIGLGTKAKWPSRGLVTPAQAVALGGVGPALDWPQPPVFLMLSSAEQRRILTVIASYRHPPEGAGWKLLVPQDVVNQVRERTPWMRRPVPAGQQPGG